MFNSCVRPFLEGRILSEKRYPIFWIEVPDPYSHSNGGQIRCASGLSVPTVTYIEFYFTLDDRITLGIKHDEIKRVTEMDI